MRTYKFKQSISTAILVLSALVLTGCNDNDTDTINDVSLTPPPAPVPVNYTYEVSVINLTAAQPMSPLAISLHNEGMFWHIGESASDALELLAESGDNSDLLAQDVVLSGASGAGVLMPGMSETVSVTLQDVMPMKISLVSMLVNTNDAFTGINALDISNLMAGESISLQTSSYDAGTENNSEMSTTIPGPAAGGEGYNELRDDVDFVAMHPGVVSQDDGLTTSALTYAHRFDNPTLHVVITRVE